MQSDEACELLLYICVFMMSVGHPLGHWFTMRSPKVLNWSHIHCVQTLAVPSVRIQLIPLSFIWSHQQITFSLNQRHISTSTGWTSAKYVSYWWFLEDKSRWLLWTLALSSDVTLRQTFHSSNFIVHHQIPANLSFNLCSVLIRNVSMLTLSTKLCTTLWSKL